MAIKASEARSLAGLVAIDLEIEFDKIQDGKPFSRKLIELNLAYLGSSCSKAYDFYKGVYDSLVSNQ